MDTREEIDRLLAIERGVVTTETRRIRRTKLSLHNRGATAATVFVRHAVPKGWKLVESKRPVEKLRGAHLFPVNVAARSAVELEIEESTPFERTVSLTNDEGVKDIALLLETKTRLAPELAQQLDEIVAAHRKLRDTQDRIDTLHRQMGDYRKRVDEIHVQLVTLRKVPHAQKLSRHLATKMEEISNRLQQATIDVTDLEGQSLALRVGLEDRLAELTLERKKTDRVADASADTRGQP